MTNVGEGMENNRERLDILMVKNGLVESRERAKEHINKGEVKVNDRIVNKTGKKIDIDSKIEITGRLNPYVGRGGLKLEKAIEQYNIELNDKVCADIGASTGGFTDCMIQNGAKKVYAIDVGSDQLHEKLRNHDEVVSMENTNIKDVKREHLEELCDFMSVDVSFIALEKILPYALNLLKEDGEFVALIKPQFQCGKKVLNKKGVVKDKKVHKKVINDIAAFLMDSHVKIIDITSSPIKGPNGNIEYLLYGSLNNESESFNFTIIEEVVERAYQQLH